MKEPYNMPISLYEELRVRLEKAEQLLKTIKWTGSHYQIIEKIEKQAIQKKRDTKRNNSVQYMHL